MSSTPSTVWSLLCQWQLELLHEGSLRITSMLPSSRVPSGAEKMRVLSPPVTCATGFSVRWQPTQPSAVRSTVRPISFGYVEWVILPSLLKIRIRSMLPWLPTSLMIWRTCSGWFSSIAKRVLRMIISDSCVTRFAASRSSCSRWCRTTSTVNSSSAAVTATASQRPTLNCRVLCFTMTRGRSGSTASQVGFRRLLRKIRMFRARELARNTIVSVAQILHPVGASRHSPPAIRQYEG